MMPKKQVTVGRPGFIMPDGTMYKWEEVTTELKVDAKVTLPDGTVIHMGCKPMDDATSVLVALLEATCQLDESMH